MAGERKTGSGKSGGAAGATIEGVAEEVKKKKRVSPIEFLRQVRAEAEKVTWTTWSETWVSTLMVLSVGIDMIPPRLPDPRLGLFCASLWL